MEGRVPNPTLSDNRFRARRQSENVVRGLVPRSRPQQGTSPRTTEGATNTVNDQRPRGLSPRKPPKPVLVPNPAPTPDKNTPSGPQPTMADRYLIYSTFAPLSRLSAPPGVRHFFVLHQVCRMNSALHGASLSPDNVIPAKAGIQAPTMSFRRRPESRPPVSFLCSKPRLTRPMSFQ